MFKSLSNKQIVLGVCGGIAAYKSVELLRSLRKAAATVRVVMTRNAAAFVGPLTFKALSGLPVCTDLFGAQEEGAIRHIDWAREADALLIAPATANMIGKMAGGIADDALSTLYLAVTSPVVVCPSMNTHMYLSAAVQRNLATLKADGCRIVEPAAGDLACGTSGPGRLPEPAEIIERLAALLTEQDLAGQRFLVTAGPTCEPIDPVRFISNPSSGKMGYAIARAAAQRGAKVVLVSGPTHLPAPPEIEVIQVRTAREMAQAVFERIDDARVVIKAAAVSDFSPRDPATRKIKKHQAEMTLVLQKNVDILMELGRRKKDQVLVGFAAETDALEKNATGKLAEKNLDMIVANLVGTPGSGFQSDTNRVTFFFAGGERETLPEMTKEDVAHRLLDRILERCLAGGRRS